LIDELGLRAGVRSGLGRLYLRTVVDTDWESSTIFEHDEWDVLVLVDGCRYDLFCEVENEYEYIETSEPRMSPASCTWEWLPTLVSETDETQLAEMAYITANPQSCQFLDGEEFGYLDEVWRDAWDRERGTVLPRPVTDRAIRYWRGRTDETDRMILHYMQPHVPFVKSPRSPALRHENFSSGEEVADDWVLASRGERDISAVWEDYRENLRIVLDDIEILLENLDAESVVISSDHGNAAGEYGIYGHPALPHPKLREIPWAKVNADDSHTHEPSEHDSQTAESVDEMLAALGYR